MESTGVDVEMMDSEVCRNMVGILAEGWRRPELRGSNLRDLGASARPCAFASSRRSVRRPGGKVLVARCEGRRAMSADAQRGRAKCSHGGEREGADTKLSIEGCDFNRNQRAVEVVTHSNISSYWCLPLGRQ